MRWRVSGRRSIGRWPRRPSRKLIVELFVEGTHNNECDGNPIRTERRRRRTGPFASSPRHRRRSSRADCLTLGGNETPCTPTDKQTDILWNEWAEGGEGENVVGKMQKGSWDWAEKKADKQCGLAPSPFFRAVNSFLGKVRALNASSP